MTTPLAVHRPLALATLVMLAACPALEGDEGGAETDATSTPGDTGTNPTAPGTTSPTTSVGETSDDETSVGSTTAAADTGSTGSDETTSGIECTRLLEGEIEGCDCYAFGGQGAGPYYCGGDLLCDAATTTCSSSMACDTVEADPEPNDSAATATDLGMICSQLPWHGQLEPGGSDWYTWRGFLPTAGCGDPGGVETYDDDIEVCFYTACIDGLGDIGEIQCGDGTPAFLPDGTAGCCEPSGASDSLVAYDCPQGVEVWVELRNTTDVCIGYEAQLNLS